MRNPLIVLISVSRFLGACSSSSSGSTAATTGAGGTNAGAGGSSSGGDGGGGGSSGGSGASGGNGVGGSGGSGVGGSGGSGVGGGSGGAGGGGGGAVALCIPFTPCGGTLTGTWTWAKACVTVPGDITGGKCPSATATFTVDQHDGTITFNADGSWTETDTTKTTAVVNVPKTCVTGGDCATVTNLGTVTDAGDHCVGTQVNGPKMAMEKDTFTSSGTTYTLVNKMETWSYCVAGNTLTMSKTDAAGTIPVLTATK